jgi:hypothetical protein
MLSEDPRLWASLGAAVRFGVARWKPLLPRVTLQSLLIGFAVIYVVETRTSTPSPPAPALPAQPGFSSTGLSFPTTGTHVATGFSFELKWVLDTDQSNGWLSKISDEAREAPSPISRYLVASLTVLIGTFFIVGYSLLYLGRPVIRKTDPRLGFDVLPVAVEPLAGKG